MQKLSVEQVRCLCGEVMKTHKEKTGRRGERYFYYACECGSEAAICVDGEAKVGGFVNENVYGELKLEGDEWRVIWTQDRKKFPRFPLNPPLELEVGIPDGVYDTAEGQYRVGVEEGKITWTCYLQDGDMDDYAFRCKGVVPRPMTIREAIQTIKIVMVALGLGQQVADYIAASAEVSD